MDWPAISKDWIVEGGRKGRGPSAQLQSLEAPSIHMEYHTLFTKKKNFKFPVLKAAWLSKPEQLLINTNKV